jgi:hypothetical protein
MELNCSLLDKNFGGNIVSLTKTGVYYDASLAKKSYDMHYSHKRKQENYTNNQKHKKNKLTEDTNLINYKN